MCLFFVPDISGAVISLPDEEARHCTGVLRLRAGQSIILTDGKGFFYDASIQSATKKQVLVHIDNKQEEVSDRNYRLHIAIAPTKNISRFEWFLEKVTEIGIDEITPVITHNSERRNLRTERLEKVIISAMKQSVKATKPRLNPVISADEFLNYTCSDCQLFIAYCGAEHNELLKNCYSIGSNALILIGPEGDFTPEEVDKATVKGFKAISLGNSRLRTETAGVIACHSIYLLNQH